MENKFRQVEKSFIELKKQFQAQEISRPAFIEKLKELRIKDDKGHYWMIGAQSGQWYFYDGKNWSQAEPPYIDRAKTPCPCCGYENPQSADACGRCGWELVHHQPCCPKCGAALERQGQECPRCGKKNSVETGEPDEEKMEVMDDARHEVTVRSLKPLSVLFFMGTLGLFIGIFFGAFAGATGFLLDRLGSLPLFFREIQGKLVGGIIYAAMGAVAGFVILGIAGFLNALIFNLISSFVGGIKIRTDKKNP